MRALTRTSLLGLLLAAPSCWSDASNAPPVTAFASLPNIHSVALSPNGKSVAWIDSGALPEHVVVVDVVNSKIRQVISAGTAKLRGLLWSDDDTLLYDASITRLAPNRLRLKYETNRVF